LSQKSDGTLKHLELERIEWMKAVKALETFIATLGRTADTSRLTNLLTSWNKELEKSTLSISVFHLREKERAAQKALVSRARELLVPPTSRRYVATPPAASTPPRVATAIPTASVISISKKDVHSTQTNYYRGSLRILSEKRGYLGTYTELSEPLDAVLHGDTLFFFDKNTDGSKKWDERKPSEVVPLRENGMRLFTCTEYGAERNSLQFQLVSVRTKTTRLVMEAVSLKAKQAWMGSIKAACRV